MKHRLPELGDNPKNEQPSRIVHQGQLEEQHCLSLLRRGLWFSIYRGPHTGGKWLTDLSFDYVISVITLSIGGNNIFDVMPDN